MLSYCLNTEYQGEWENGNEAGENTYFKYKNCYNLKEIVMSFLQLYFKTVFKNLPWNLKYKISKFSIKFSTMTSSYTA